MSPGHPGHGDRPRSRAACWLGGAVLCLALAACDQGAADNCCVEHVRQCVDDLDICAWQCDQQTGDADCYRSCIITVDECALTCED
jgi:hypothetical protein